MKVAVDTNTLAYAEGVNGADLRRRAIDVIKSIPAHNIVLPAQVLGELFAVLVRKDRWPPDEARQAVTWWMDGYETVETSPAVLAVAFSLAVDHRVPVWDAVILSVAANARCRVLLSEDMQDGFSWNGVTVVNPFRDVPNILLAMAQADASPDQSGS